jgi:hypothetical protein
MAEIKNGYIILKAFRVYHDGLLHDDYSHDQYIIDHSEIVYGRTAGEAKSKVGCLDEGSLGRSVEYTDLKAKRDKYYDLVFFEGDEVERWRMEHDMKVKARLHQMYALSDDDMYYVQDSRSYVGNAVLWWGLESNGYVTDLKRAQKYTKAEIVSKFGDGRETDVIWPASHVEGAVREYVDAQGLERQNCI